MSQLWGVLEDDAGPVDLGDLLGTGVSPRVPVPLAGHLKDELRGERGRLRHAAVMAVVSRAPVLHHVDPRELRATQGGFDRLGVMYYLGPAFAQLGLTYADHGDPGNAHPGVYVRAPDGSDLILAGHHRATVALLRGRPLLTRLVVEGGDAADRAGVHPGARVVTSTFVIGSSTQPPCVVVSTGDAAVQTLTCRGLTPRHATSRVAYALTGQARRSGKDMDLSSPALYPTSPEES